MNEKNLYIVFIGSEDTSPGLALDRLGSARIDITSYSFGSLHPLGSFGLR